MTVESGHEPTEWASVPRPTTQPAPAAQSVHYNSARHGSHVEESPELLRWRADLLMDEMMMGGVDVSAADGNRTFSGVDAPVVQRPQTLTNGGTTNGGSHGGANGGSFQSDYGRSPRDGYERNPYENSSRTHGGNGTNTSPSSRYGNEGQSSQSSQNNSSQTYSIQSNSSQNYGNRSYDAPNYSSPNYDAPNSDASNYGSPANNSPASGYVPYTREPQENGTPSNGYPRPAESHRPIENNSGYATPAPNNNFERRDLGSDVRAFDTRSSETQHNEVQPGASQSYEVRSNDLRHGESPERYTPRSEMRPDANPNRTYDEPLRQAPTRPTPATPLQGPIHEPDNVSYNKSSYDSRYDAANDLRAGAATYGYESESSGRGVRRDDAAPLDQAPSSALNRGEPSPRSVEAPYEPYRREPTNAPPAEPAPPAMATRPPLTPLSPVEPPRPVTPPRVTPPPVDQHTQWATGPDKWEYQDFGSNPDEVEDPSLAAGYPAPDRRLVQDSAVRSDPAQFVGAMSMGNKKRSTLLPRSSTLDVDTLHREISDLHGEIASLLPVGNETGERARHLLDKAYSILQSDPMRSAEVEYYMQQVRTIVQRLYQARQWSDLYRQRLHVYLWGWLGLSAVMIIARFLFQPELERSMMWLAGVYEDHFLVTHWATFIGTAFAGALGGAIGALYTMQTHARGEYSFFDRKYGLRGLILPFMGLIVGALGYLIFGLIFALVGINPAQSLTAAIVPTMAAFAFGFSQESIYGTRN